MFAKTSFSIQYNTVIALGSANMSVLYAGLGRDMAADYDHRSCILSGAGQRKKI
jgi:hypothetical protein